MRLGVVTSYPTNRAVGIISLLLDPLKKAMVRAKWKLQSPQNNILNLFISSTHKLRLGCAFLSFGECDDYKLHKIFIYFLPAVC